MKRTKALNVSELNNLIIETLKSKLDEKVFNNLFGNPRLFDSYDLTCRFDTIEFRLIEASDGSSNMTIHNLDDNGELVSSKSYAKLTTNEKKEFVEFLKSKTYTIYSQNQGDDYIYYTLYEDGLIGEAVKELGKDPDGEININGIID